MPQRKTFSSLPDIQIPIRPKTGLTGLFGIGARAQSNGWRMYSNDSGYGGFRTMKNSKTNSISPQILPVSRKTLPKASFGIDKVKNLPLLTKTPTFSEEVEEENEQDENGDSEIMEEDEVTKGFRPPRAVQAAYLAPLRRKPTYNIPVCDLQLRSYSARNLEFMADMALRAAYFLDLPASGPVALPRIIERWTVPKAHFIHKKVQENYERKTLRRLVQIKDGDPEVVRLWLGFLRKHAYYGVGMKANVWEFVGIDVAKDMDTALQENRAEIEPLLSQFAFKKGSKLGDELIETVHMENRWQASGGSAPMISTPNWRKPLN
ncbi:hypothetical protein K3495_g3005 [Podosphaera aphanis]|nr:hypothetical protein K3495_g3005 [Podosphaera aphanis]